MSNNPVSRIKRTKSNFRFSVILYIIKMVLGMITKIIFTHYFLRVYFGLNNLFSNILTLLSLAELGFGNAIVYSLYKPIAENDEEKIKELMHLYKKFYTIIAFVVLAIGLSLIPFLKYLVTDIPDGIDINLKIVYLIFLINSVISYFFSYRNALLLTNQRQDIQSKISIVSVVGLHLAQIIFIVIFKNYYLYILLTVVFTLLENLITYFVTNKLYPELIKKPDNKLSKAERKEITKNVYALIFHRLEYALVCGTDNIIISALISTSVLGSYSAYSTIITYVSTIVLFTVSAMRGSLGNYISTKSPEETSKLYNKLNFGFMWLVGWCSICLLCLFQPFVKLWSNYSLENYLLSDAVMLLLVISFYFTRTRDLIQITKECAGIFWQDRYKALFTALSNIIISIILTKLIGLPGVILGTIISTVVIPLWIEPKVVYKHYFKESVLTYIVKYLTYTLTTIIIAAVTYFTCSLISLTGISELIVKGIICVFVPNLLFILIYFKTSIFNSSVKLFKKIFAK